MLLQGVYIAVVLGVVHFYWLVKADIRQPLLLGACLAVLLAVRAPQFAANRTRARRSGSDPIESP